MADYYEILGVSKDATQDEIKSAFRKRARELHPDVNKAPDAEEKFKELGKAYETLSDDNKKNANWKREDEENMNNVLYIFNQLKDTSSYKEDNIAEKTIKWLESLKDRVKSMKE